MQRLEAAQLAMAARTSAPRERHEAGCARASAEIITLPCSLDRGTRVGSRGGCVAISHPSHRSRRLSL